MGRRPTGDAALAEREAALDARSRQLDARLAQVEERERAAEERERIPRDPDAARLAQIEARLDELRAAEEAFLRTRRELADHSDAIAAREQLLAQRERDLDEREDGWGGPDVRELESRLRKLETQGSALGQTQRLQRWVPQARAGRHPPASDRLTRLRPAPRAAPGNPQHPLSGIPGRAGSMWGQPDRKGDPMKRKIITVGAAALVVAGGGAAIAATTGGTPQEESKAVVDDAAKQLGVTPSKLSSALKKALENRVDAAVAAGRLTKEQGDAIKARIEAEDYPMLGGFGFGHHGGPGMHGIGHLDAAASYLGMTADALRTQLESGKSLADVAKSKGKSVDGLVSALVADEKKELDAAVKAGPHHPGAGRRIPREREAALHRPRERDDARPRPRPGRLPRARSGSAHTTATERSDAPSPAAGTNPAAGLECASRGVSSVGRAPLCKSVRRRSSRVGVLIHGLLQRRAGATQGWVGRQILGESWVVSRICPTMAVLRSPSF